MAVRGVRSSCDSVESSSRLWLVSTSRREFSSPFFRSETSRMKAVKLWWPAFFTTVTASSTGTSRPSRRRAMTSTTRPRSRPSPVAR